MTLNLVSAGAPGGWGWAEETHEIGGQGVWCRKVRMRKRRGEAAPCAEFLDVWWRDDDVEPLQRVFLIYYSYFHHVGSLFWRVRVTQQLRGGSILMLPSHQFLRI